MIRPTLLQVLVLTLAAAAQPEVELIACGGPEVLRLAWPAGAPVVLDRLEIGSLPGIPAELQDRFRTTAECKAFDPSSSELLVASSGGAIAVLDLESRVASLATGAPNAHSIVRLPGGRIASAASVHAEGDRVLVHDATSGRVVQEFPLPSAHGLVYDPMRRRLWALGMAELVEYAVDPASGALELLRPHPLPEGREADGHDLIEVPESNELLLSTAAGVWLFDRELRSFRPHPELGRTPHVKSLDIHPRTHRLVYVQADEGVWWSSALRFLHPAGEHRGGRFYKARWRRRTDQGHGPPALASPPEAEAPPRGQGQHVLLAFGSCADLDAGTTRVWRRIASAAPDAMVLLGDTPYIDSVDPKRQAERYAAFDAFPPMVDLSRTADFFATWDDHDFGRNDADGRLQGKRAARDAFVAARSKPPFRGPYGEAEEGVYTSFRRGSIEVFLLDTRWFARTEKSPFDPEAQTLLGARQWAWLRAGLRSSTAPFKILACGMVWNDALRPGKTDAWGAYPSEWRGLLALLQTERIEGVILVGGDIHRPRVIQHDTQAALGYPLYEFISSPMHHRVIASAAAAHPGLLFDAGVGHIALFLSASEDRLIARLQTPDGLLDERSIQGATLRRAQ